MLGSAISSFFDGHDDVSFYFDGVFALNSFPKKLKKNHICIVNTSTTFEAGKHWICIGHYDNQLQVFDSLGSSPDFINTHLHVNNVKKFKFNDTPVQSPDSVQCGEYCLYYVFCRVLNMDLTFEELLNAIFVADVNINEMIIKKFYDNFEFYETDQL
jgi:hypothetical protein